MNYLYEAYADKYDILKDAVVSDSFMRLCILYKVYRVDDFLKLFHNIFRGKYSEKDIPKIIKRYVNRRGFTQFSTDEIQDYGNQINEFAKLVQERSRKQ